MCACWRVQCAALLLPAQPVIADMTILNAHNQSALAVSDISLSVHGKGYLHAMLEAAAEYNAYHRHALVLKRPALKAKLEAAGIVTLHPSGPYSSYEAFLASQAGH